MDPKFSKDKNYCSSQQSTKSNSITSCGSSRLCAMYKSEIDKQISFLLNKKIIDKNISNKQEYFKTIFLNNIFKSTGTQICLDNQIVYVIQKKINDIMKEKSVNNVTLNAQYVNLLEISTTLYKNKFISKSKYKTFFSFKDFFEIKLQKYIRNMQTMIDLSQKQLCFLSQQSFKQILGITAGDFYDMVSQQQIELTETVYEALSYFEAFLLVKKKVIVHKNTVISKSALNPKDFMGKFASYLCLQSQPERLKKIQNQLQQFKKFLKGKFAQNIYKNIFKYFQIYGSYRNKTYTSKSDIDLTLFFHDYKKELFSQRKMIKSQLFIIRNIFVEVQQQQKCLQNKILNIKQIKIVAFDNVKVQFIRVYFNNMPISSIDIVINNDNGVNNSKMIEKFTKNQVIRCCAILIKNWGKNKGLINPYSLSSYGVILMLLYFLMKQKFIQFIKEEQLKTFTFDSMMKKQALCNEVLFDFINFYSQNSTFMKNNEIICLVKDCKYDHSQLLKQKYVVNIHDPFDNTNAGRLKIGKKMLFFQVIQQTKCQLLDFRCKSKEQIKNTLQKTFGIKQ